MFNDQLKGGLMNDMLVIRYLLTLMGAMAMFTGLLYNEFFAIPNNWFGSCFETNVERCQAGDASCNPIYYPKGCDAETYASQGCEMTCVYPFGVDPAWYLSP